MGSSACPPPADRCRRLDLAIGVLLAIGMAAAGLSRPERLAAESVIRESIARELWRNTTVGRQALVASPWWAPFPTLMRLPLAPVADRMPGWPLASLALSAVAVFGALTTFAHAIRASAPTAPTWPLLLLLAAHPFFIEQTAGAGPGPLVLWFALWAAAGLADWIERRALRGLIRMAAGAALLAGSSLDMVPWVAVLYGILLLHLAAGRFERAQRSAVLWLALTPPLAVLAFWILMNRAIMGDLFYFLRGLARHRRLLTGFVAAPFPYSPSDLLAVAIGLGVATLGAWRGRWSAAALGLLAILPAVIALPLGLRGLLDSPAPLLFIPGPLVVMALSRLPPPDAAPRLRAALLTAAAFAALGYARWPERSLADPARRDAGQLAAERARWLPRLESHVRRHSPHVRVFVAGFDSFSLLDARSPDLFVPALDFDFGAAERSYRGHRLFVLVRRPERRGALESIHWKYPQIYERGSRHTLYDSDWGDWRLFEIIQPRPPEIPP